MADFTSLPLPAGSVIGILGGGQLGRMTALAAARLGYPCHVFCPEVDAPATQVTNLVTRADYLDRFALSHFAAATDVITYEFENIDLNAVKFLESECDAVVRPSSVVLAITQNRIFEKAFINDLKIATVDWCTVKTLAQVQQAFTQMGGKIVIKTAMLGYDGKGQVMVEEQERLPEIWSEFTRIHAGISLIAEKFDPFESEGSVIVARSQSGETRAYELVENFHQDHILSETRVPGNFTAETKIRAEEIAVKLAESLEVIGLLAVEFFIRADGSLKVNELAPRPHNSGHWTMDGAATSQFEQLVRAIVGLPLGSTQRLYDTVVMENLIGESVNQWPSRLADEPEARLHLYGKTAVKPGRKMGHVNRVK
ncbi:MAG: 5-(carboxyamino)imidazole ribonucleotide synthase [Candidatus Pacebacteria bacterium]|nr:5-(carboxyamino)imidazole ribonucleotide synthase [Candidatus Paceibacterota bacterium]